MNLRQLVQELVQQAGLDSAAIIDNHPIVFVDTTQQSLTWVDALGGSEYHYPVSTSRYGVGQRENSLQTPAGIHHITQKIGANEPAGRVFKSRVATDEVCLPSDYDGEQDVITSRILRLAGLQPGFNAGGDVDSFNRYIYIHGTPDETHIGQPASIGCIRMRNQDVIDLFTRVDVDDPVIID